VGCSWPEERFRTLIDLRLDCVADWHWQAAHDKQGEVGGFLSMLSDALADADCPRMETVLKSAIQAQHEAVAALDELKDP